MNKLAKHETDHLYEIARAHKFGQAITEEVDIEDDEEDKQFSNVIDDDIKSLFSGEIIRL